MVNKTTVLACAVGTVVLSVHPGRAGSRGHDSQRGFGPFTEWSTAVSVESTFPFADESLNTTFQEGCPAISADGLNLYMASNRGGLTLGLDIWVSQRDQKNDPWRAPVNLGAPINTGANEFCPTPLADGRTLLFVSTKPGGCGGSDIYASHRLGRNTWSEPVHFGCDINSAGDEASPFLVTYDHGDMELYFSSNRAGGFSEEAPGATIGDSDIYVSEVRHGFLRRPQLVEGVNTAADDSRPNVRSDGEEIFFDSNRSDRLNIDIWTSTRRHSRARWEEPTSLANVNSIGNETRAFLSHDAKTLYLGSTRVIDSEGAGDLYVATRVTRRKR
jgi:Tol biopolymer transport system component